MHAGVNCIKKVNTKNNSLSSHDNISCEKYFVYDKISSTSRIR